MDPHYVLDIESDAEKEDITAAYREKVKEVHPDVGGSKEEFKQVKEAYQQLISEEEMPSADSVIEENNETRPSVVYPATIQYLNYERAVELGLYNNRVKLFEIAEQDDRFGESDFGSFRVVEGESILEAAERTSMSWPYSCRGGACANCAIKIVEGDVTTPSYHILSAEQLDEGFRLSCIGKPLSEEIKIIFNIKNHPTVQELLLPSKE